MTPVRSQESRPGSAALVGILLAVDRPDMRRIAIEIRAPDPELLLARIDPLPHLHGRCEALQTGLALDAHQIGRKPVAVPAAAAAAMIRAVARSLVAARDPLPVIVAECAGDAGHESGLVHRAQRVVELQLEAAVHAADHIVLERHAGALRRDRILPGEVRDDVPGHGPHDGARFALLADQRLDALLYPV